MRFPNNRLLLLSALCSSLALGASCKRSQGASDTSVGTQSGSDAAKPPTRRQRRKAGLPRPLRLPASAPIIVHLDHPQQVVGGLRAYAPQLPDTRDLLRTLLGNTQAGTFETELAAVVDLSRPWDAASVEGQLIVQLPILPARVQSVSALLSDKPPVGKFGAVDLQRGDVPGPKLAWLNTETRTLTMADTERGIATGPRLAKAYGKQPVRIRLEGTEARKYAPQFALTQLQVEGAGPHDLSVIAESVPPEVFARLDKLEAGALTGLLETSVLAVGGSSKYSPYADNVRKILADTKRTVDRQNFLIKGNLEALRKRFAAVARSWNGRTMVGVGPKNHVLIGVGANDPKHLGGALFHFIDGVIDNLGTARTFGVDVPRIRFKRNAVRAAEQNIAILVLEGARKVVPSEARALIDDRGELRIAMAFPTNMGAGMIVVGPASESTLTQWLEDTAKATSAGDSAKDYISAAVAVDPAALAPLTKPGADPSFLLGLSPDRERTLITSVREGNNLNLRIKGPKVVAHTRRMGSRRAAVGAADTPSKAAPSKSAPSKPARPARSAPARATPSRGKPI